MKLLKTLKLNISDNSKWWQSKCYIRKACWNKLKILGTKGDIKTKYIASRMEDLNYEDSHFWIIKKIDLNKTQMILENTHRPLYITEENNKKHLNTTGISPTEDNVNHVPNDLIKDYQLTQYNNLKFFSLKKQSMPYYKPRSFRDAVQEAFSMSQLVNPSKLPKIIGEKQKQRHMQRKGQTQGQQQPKPQTQKQKHKQNPTNYFIKTHRLPLNPTSSFKESGIINRDFHEPIKETDYILYKKRIEKYKKEPKK